MSDNNTTDTTAPQETPTTPATPPANGANAQAAITQAQVEEWISKAVQQASERPVQSQIGDVLSKLAEVEKKLEGRRMDNNDNGNNGTNGAPSTPASPAEPSTETKTFTQEQLGKHVSDARKDEREKANAQIEALKGEFEKLKLGLAGLTGGAPKEPEQVTKDDDSKPPAWFTSYHEDIVSRIGAIETKTKAESFASAFAKSGLPDDVRDVAETLVEATKPDDIGKYLESIKGKFGVKPAEPAAPQAGNGQSAQEPQSPAAPEPKPAKPMPGAGPTTTDTSDAYAFDPARLTREDVNRLASEGRLVSEFKKWKGQSADGQPSIVFGRPPPKG